MGKSEELEATSLHIVGRAKAMPARPTKRRGFAVCWVSTLVMLSRRVLVRRHGGWLTATGSQPWDAALFLYLSDGFVAGARQGVFFSTLLADAAKQGNTC